VLAFGQHAFALGTVIALAERPRSNRRSRAARPDRRVRWPSRLVATAAEDRLNFRRQSAYFFCERPGAARWRAEGATKKSPTGRGA
jgi:hypothetical protein